MKIRFDYYTSSVSLAAEAFTLAEDCGADEVCLRKNTYGDIPFNIDGEIDFAKMTKLMEFFETNGFSETN